MRDSTTKRQIGLLICALLLGAAVALPAGMILGGIGQGEPEGAAAAPTARPTARAFYSPKVLHDPYFLNQQRKGAEALEAYCREQGEMCGEARAARRWLAANGG